MLKVLERLPDLVPPRRVVILLGPVAATLAALFLYLESRPGALDRLDRVRGRDFLNFYVLGQIVAEDGGRLYDAEHFRDIQETVASITDTRPRYYPMYPPATASFFAPLASLDYGSAILVWWTLQAAGFALCFGWAYRTARPPPAWRAAFLIALAAYYPVFSNFVNGQLAVVLLLSLLAGLELHQRGRRFAAGCVLAFLTLKPQFAVGPLLWLFLRRDGRTLAGFSISLAAQSAAVALWVGPEVFRGFFGNLQTYSDMARRESTTPDHQHALGGVLSNLLGPEWADAGKLLHAGYALLAAGLLWQVIRQVRQASREGGLDAGRHEHCAVAVYMLLATPHLLTYDLVLLLPALAWLWAPVANQRPAERVCLAGLLYLAGAAPPLYYFTGFSLVPLALVGALMVLAQLTSPSLAHESAGRPLQLPN